MARIRLEKKHDIAASLYASGNTCAKSLADKVGTTEKTMRRWIAEGNWEKLRKNIPLVKQEQLEKLLDELEEFNNFIQLKPEGLRFADSKEADARRKLLKDIEALENEASIADTVSVSIAINKFVSQTDLEMAKTISNYFDAFIKEKLK